MLRHQTGGAILLEPAQQPEDLPPTKTDQFTGIGYAKTTRLNRNRTSSRLNSRLLMDTTGTAHLPGP
jgi:hypothetical protein